MSHEVRARSVEASPTAVVARATTWEELPRVWSSMLDDVYAFVRSGGTTQTGHNVMLYLDDIPNVEIGVQVGAPFEATGSVQPSELPAGRVASTVHRGSYDGLGGAHADVLAWCRANGLATTGTRWEVYGDWHDDPEQMETEVCYLLA